MTSNDQERETGSSPERLPLGELRPDDRGQDEVREALEESTGLGEALDLGLEPHRFESDSVSSAPAR